MRSDRLEPRAAAVLFAASKHGRIGTQSERRLALVCGLLAVIYIVSASRFFTAGRSVVFYMPAILALAGLGLTLMREQIAGTHLGAKGAGIATGLAALTIVAVGLPSLLETRAAVRGAGHLDTFLVKPSYAGRPVFHLGRHKDYILATPATLLDVDKLCAAPDNAILYLQRAVPIPHFDMPAPVRAALDHIRGQPPLFKTRDYNGLRLYLYEFPLKQPWFDRGDWLSTHRALFEAAAVKQGFCPKPGSEDRIVSVD